MNEFCFGGAFIMDVYMRIICVSAHSRTTVIAAVVLCKRIGRFQAIKTDVLLIFSFITGDKTEFLSPMMFSNEYITGI